MNSAIDEVDKESSDQSCQALNSGSMSSSKPQQQHEQTPASNETISDSTSNQAQQNELNSGLKGMEGKYTQLIYMADNLQSLDEVMYHNTQTKGRSSSINIDQSEVGQQNLKNDQEKNDIIKADVFNTIQGIEGLFDMQNSISCPQQTVMSPTIFKDTFFANNQVQESTSQQNIECINPSIEVTQDQNEIKQTQEQKIDKPIELETNTINSDKIGENRMQKFKNNMQIAIQSQNSTNGVSQKMFLFSDKCNYSSPINEIQSDNSSQSCNDQITQPHDGSDNITQSQVFSQLLQDKISQKNIQTDPEDVMKNDEFTMMFQSNCPIKSPTFTTKIRKKIVQIEKKTSFSLDNSTNLNTDSQNENYEQQSNDCKRVDFLNQAMQNETNRLEQLNVGFAKTIGPLSDESIKKDENENYQEHKESIQLGFIADIKSVRNYKVNAFRSRLNLSLNENDNDDFRKKSSTINSDITLLQEPVSIKDLQRNNIGYNTVETPGTNKRKIQVSLKNTPKHSLSLRSNHHIEETNDEHKEIDCSVIGKKIDVSNDSSNADIESSQKKSSRKFQRKELRIKVNPLKAEDKEEIWDELTSTDQQIQEVPIVSKAKQGSNKFEDIYYLLNGKPLGEGTSGCVYQCRKKNSDDQTIYAVKVMRNVDEEMSKNIFQTFGIQYRLQHESISKVYEVYYNEDNQTIHYIMDFIPFRPLDQILKDKKRVLKEIEASSIIQKLLKAVCYMEQRGVCHRDLKPENILISENLQQIRIIDFGISKSFVKSQRVQHITQYYKHKMYTPTGTPSYKAPEILLGAGYTQLVDMWAIGVIAYQLVTRGKHPFKCDSQIEQDRRISKYQFNQEEEGWIKASPNSKNFIKSLLRPNRMPAFEALKHPWIEQRKIEIPADDDNHISIKQEKKPSNDSMTISVPVHFQPRLFGGFGIAATNSEQQQRSNFSKINDDGDVYDDNQLLLRACNTINSTNEFDSHPTGNNNAHISNYGQQKKRSKIISNINEDNDNETQLNAETQAAEESVNLQQNSQKTQPVKKKHFIQGFASTQDVVHVVMRQKLSESREKMMQFFLKANTIIKTLEEEQLNQIYPKTQGMKRTQSAEKQSDSPTTPDENFNKNNLNNSGNTSEINLFKNSSFANQYKDEVCQNHLNNNLNNEQNIHQNQGQQSQNYSQTSSEESNRFMVKANNSSANQSQNLLNILNKGAQSSLNSVGKNNNSINDGNNTSYNNNSLGAGNAMMHSTSDFSSMKFSSLMNRKTSCNRQRDRRVVRRNSSQQTNCMEKSIIFTKEVIGELQKDPVIQETFGSDTSSQTIMNSINPSLQGFHASSLMEATSNQNMTDSIMLKSLSTNNFGFLVNKTTTIQLEQNMIQKESNKSIQNNYMYMYNKQSNNFSNSYMSSGIYSKASTNFMSEDQKKQEEEKWKFITENMDQRSDSGIMEKDDKGSSSDEDDSDSSNSSSSNNNIRSSDNNNLSIDLTNLLLNSTQPNTLQNRERDQSGNPESSSSKKQSIDNINDILDNENISSISSKKNEQQNSSSNPASEECKEYLQEKSSNKDSSSQSSSSRNRSNISQSQQVQQGGIFQKTPYTNYMNSSKDDKLNQTLINIQNAQDGNIQPTAVLTTSGNSSKENISSNHSISHKSESSQNKNNQKHQFNSITEDKNQQMNTQGAFKEINLNQANLNNSHCSQCSNNSSGCINCQSLQKPNAHMYYNSDFVLSDNGQEYKTNNKNYQINQSLGNIQPDIQLRSSKNIDFSQNSFPYDKISKEKLTEMGITDSAGNNLSFIDMNNSNMIQSVNVPSSEDFISNQLKRNNNNPLISLSVSQASSINAGCISLSGSGNTLRSLHAITQNSNPNNIANLNNNNNNNYNNNSNSEASNAGANTKEKVNTSRFKNQSENNSFNSSNSILKKIQGNKLEIDMSESKSYNPDILTTSANNTQKQYIETGLNSSNEATPSKFNQLNQGEDQYNQQSNLKQSQISSNSIEASKDIFTNRQNSNNKPTIFYQTNNDYQEPQQNITSNILASQNSQNKSQDSTPENKQSNRKEKQGNKNSQADQNTTNTQIYLNNLPPNKQQFKSIYSTIFEESSEGRSCVTSSIAQSQKLTEIDSPKSFSAGQQFNRNYTRSLTQINQSNSERNESSLTNQSALNYCVSSILTNQTSIPVISKDSNGKQENNFIPQCGITSEEIDPHHHECDSQNENKNNCTKKNCSIQSKTNILKIVQSISAIHNHQNNQQIHNQLEEVFGQMLNSSSFMKQDEAETNQDNNNASNHDQIHQFNISPTNMNKLSTLLHQQEKQNSPNENGQETNKASICLSEQPPLLKHRTSSRLLENSNSFNTLKQSQNSSCIEQSQDDFEDLKNKPNIQLMIERAEIEVIPENQE